MLDFRQSLINSTLNKVLQRRHYPLESNTAAIEGVKVDACVDILMRQNKYLNNIVEQDHRAIKRVTQPMLGVKLIWNARILIGGIETMHMIRKGQMHRPAGTTVSAADQFYSLALEYAANETAFLGHTPLTRDRTCKRPVNPH